MPDPTTNRYCSAIGIAPFSLDGFFPPKEPSLLHWMILVLVEQGEPMTMEAIADRLSELGVESNTGNLVYSLRKAWHGLRPVYQDSRGLFGLDLQDVRLKYVLMDAGIWAPPTVHREEAPAPPLRGPHEAVTLEEMEALCEGGIPSSFSNLRAAAGLLEALDVAMTLDEVNAWIGARLKSGTFRLTPAGVRGWRSDLVSREPDGRLVLNRESLDLPAMRASVHAQAYVELRHRAERERQARRSAEWEAQRVLEKQREAEAASKRSHAILHLVPSAIEPAAGVVLDVEARRFTTFPTLDAWPGVSCLEGFDVVVGIDVRNALLALGVDPDPFHLVDLGPPQKTRKINKSGRKLLITTDLLMRGTVGMSMGEPERIARYIQEGDHRHLAARLESDAKSLYAYYMFGRLHGCVRLRWGFLDENLSVDWRLPGEESLWDMLERADKEGREVEVVLGSAPGWNDPWSRAQIGVVRHDDPWRRYAVELPDRTVSIDEIQAARLGIPRDHMIAPELPGEHLTEARR